MLFYSRYLPTHVTLGSGSYGSVSLYIRVSDNVKVAVKKIRNDKVFFYFKDHNECFKPLEVEILNQVKHIHSCIEILDYLVCKDQHVIVMEYFENSLNLHNCLDEINKFNEKDAGMIFVQIVSTMLLLQSKDISHNDISLANVLLVRCSGDSPLIKLIDFGLANFRSVLDRHNSYAPGTEFYLPPNNRDCLYSAAESWSLGVILGCLTCGLSKIYKPAHDYFCGDKKNQEIGAKKIRRIILSEALRRHDVSTFTYQLLERLMTYNNNAGVSADVKYGIYVDASDYYLKRNSHS
ncbi:hypothetical protein QYM36_005256 [Artemia franciscana]|uniref:non-specific serine/threonine protein kinase n=1 Tax=Artemia franciscana TaxID=6661 RepID=A0AA88HX14_ARTSF|nr:hypothetical protein QYM36_005256 [Artemia franciscana]